MRGSPSVISLALSVLAVVALAAQPSQAQSSGPVGFLQGAYLEPAPGKILQGMGQFDDPNGDYLDALVPFEPAAPYPGHHLHFRNIQADTAVHGHLHAFGQGTEGVDDVTDLIAALNDDATNGMIPHLQIDFFNIQAGAAPKIAVDDILAGGASSAKTLMEAQITLFGEALAAFGKPVFLRIGGEFNNDFGDPVTTYHPYDFPIAFQRAHDLLIDAGALQTAFVWCWLANADTDYADSDVMLGSKWYPGDAYVDWFGLDAFGVLNFTAGTGGSGSLDEVETFLGVAAAANRPVFLCESSETDEDITIDTVDGNDVINDWFVPYFDFLENHPSIEGITYISQNWHLGGGFSGWKDGRIANNDEVMDYWVGQLNDPKFIGKDSPTTLNGYGGWWDLGETLNGVGGAPKLRGTGIVKPNASLSVVLKNGKPSSPAALFIGYSALNIAFKGGVLVPTPDLTVPFTTDGSGGYTYPITWPSVATIGATAWFQFWVKEQNSPEVWASSNAMKAVTVTL